MLGFIPGVTQYDGCDSNMYTSFITQSTSAFRRTQCHNQERHIILVTFTIKIVMYHI